VKKCPALHGEGGESFSQGLSAALRCGALPGPAGVSMPKLFQLCRERFLVSNEMLLKSFLVEFKDHELLTTK
jgi:hypothetical protein